MPGLHGHAAHTGRNGLCIAARGLPATPDALRKPTRTAGSARLVEYRSVSPVTCCEASVWQEPVKAR